VPDILTPPQNNPTTAVGVSINAMANRFVSLPDSAKQVGQSIEFPVHSQTWPVIRHIPLSLSGSSFISRGEMSF